MLVYCRFINVVYRPPLAVTLYHKHPKYHVIINVGEQWPVWIRVYESPGGRLSIKCRLTRIGILMLKIRRSRDHPIFKNVGIHIPEKDGLYIQTEPDSLRTLALAQTWDVIIIWASSCSPLPPCCLWPCTCLERLYILLGHASGVIYHFIVYIYIYILIITTVINTFKGAYVIRGT